VRRATWLAGAAALLLAVSGQALAQATPDSAMVKLIRGLIQSGTLAKDVGEALLAQAQTEAIAQQHAARQMAAAGAGTAAAAGNAWAAQPGDVRVPYIPQSTRDEIKAELKSEVLAQAQAQGWAAPNETPEWSKRIRVEGDVRVRNESRFNSGGNSNTEVDWAAINQGDGYDVNKNTNPGNPALLNTTRNRTNQWRVRARLGVLADVSEDLKAGIRVDTGSDDSPVSTTQTLGGGLGKKDIWLDQAWASYRLSPDFKVTGGRFGNPFVSTDTLFSNDLNFDGIALQFGRALPERGLDLFGTLGYVPLEYSSDGFPSSSLNKSSSEDKWMLGAQFGARLKLDERNSLRGAVAYYDFHNISGQYSEPCVLYSGRDTQCSTDWSRPAFMQRGNTLMLLRNMALNPLDPDATPLPQYVWLASKFQLLDIDLRWDTRVAGRYGLRLDGNYIRNLAYSDDKTWARAAGGVVNNFERVNEQRDPGREDFRSGGNAYAMQATFGHLGLESKGDWNVLAGYKRIEPDALPDGYNDSTFHRGGTNARGYFLGANYAIDRNAWLGMRWTATQEVYGPPLSIDTLQLELNARF